MMDYARTDVAAPTIPSLLEARAAASPGGTAFHAEVAARRWRPVAWGAFLAHVCALAHDLRRQGVGRGSRFGIFAANSLEWEIAQHAALRCGAAVVGLDIHYPDAVVGALIERTGLTHVAAGDGDLLRRIAPETRSAIQHCYLLRGQASSEAGKVTDLASLAAAPGEESPNDARPDDLAVVVFSSGTTGTPKPVGYTHAQVIAAVRPIVAAYPDIPPDGRLLCWLPLANLFQRIINFSAIARGTASYLLADPRQVMDAVGVARPQLLLGVPRFYERVHAGIRAKLASAPAPARHLAAWALAHGERCAAAEHEGRRLSAAAALLRPIADRLVLRRLRAAFGGDVRYLVSGSAPLAEAQHRFYDAIGLPVYEAYGVSENIVPVALNRPGARRAGAVGRPVVPDDLRLADDGEVLIRGEGVCGGYLDEPVPEERAGPDGYWRTGDLGRLDAEGYLWLSGRKSDTFKLSTGRWIAPADIEAGLRGLPWVEHAVVSGAHRKVVVAILNLAPTAVAVPIPEGWPSEVLAVVAGFADHQRPAGALLVTEPFSIAGGELTTNLKLRRQAVIDKFRVALDALFDHLEASPRPAGSVPVLRLAA